MLEHKTSMGRDSNSSKTHEHSTGLELTLASTIPLPKGGDTTGELDREIYHTEVFLLLITKKYKLRKTC